jgi:PTS system nitrogen regulatory IIA component
VAALSTLLTPDHVVDLEGDDRESVLARLCAVAAPLVGIEEVLLLSAVREREDLSSTGFGGGMAMPHVRLTGVSKVQVVLGRVRGGVEYQALDGNPVHLLLLVVGPESDKSAYLKAMARAARFLKGEGARLVSCADDLPQAALAASQAY